MKYLNVKMFVFAVIGIFGVTAVSFWSVQFAYAQSAVTVTAHETVVGHLKRFAPEKEKQFLEEKAKKRKASEIRRQKQFADLEALRAVMAKHKSDVMGGKRNVK